MPLRTHFCYSPDVHKQECIQSLYLRGTAESDALPGFTCKEIMSICLTCSHTSHTSPSILSSSVFSTLLQYMSSANLVGMKWYLFVIHFNLHFSDFTQERTSLHTFMGHFLFRFLWNACSISCPIFLFLFLFGLSFSFWSLNIKPLLIMVFPEILFPFLIGNNIFFLKYNLHTINSTNLHA